MSTIAERLSAVNTKLNNILTNVNTQLTNKGKTAVSDLSDLSSAVGELKNPTGSISITQNGTVDVSNYASANVNVPTPEPNLQSKSIEITENGTQTITADTGYDGLDEVEVVTNVSGGGDLSEYFGSTINAGTSKQSGLNQIIKKIPSGISVVSTSAMYMFNNCSALETISLIDTSNVIYMNYMFQNCYKLETIPLLNTSNVTSMNNMFLNCSALKTISLLDTSNVTNMGSMFRECLALQTIPLLNTNKVTIMENMFYNCQHLDNVPQLDTSNVTNMMQMFYKCSRLTTIPQLNTSKVTGMSNMFKDCTNLTNESVNNILAMCANSNVTNTSYKTLASLGFTNTYYQAGVIKTLSNYQAFLDAGWTIGY